MTTLLVGASAQAVAGTKSASIVPSRNSQDNRLFISKVVSSDLAPGGWSGVENLMTARAGARHLVVAKQLRKPCIHRYRCVQRGRRAHLPSSAADSFHRRPSSDLEQSIRRQPKRPRP